METPRVPDEDGQRQDADPPGGRPADKAEARPVATRSPVEEVLAFDRRQTVHPNGPASMSLAERLCRGDPLGIRSPD